MKNNGFTLIELMMVIAIIAILSLVAVPNFLEAQIRSKVARVRSDMRSIATAIETYAVDYNRPPIGSAEGQYVFGWGEQEKDKAYIAMTTPVAYLTQPPIDPFSKEDYFRYPVYRSTRVPADNLDPFLFRQAPEAERHGYQWALRSRGPGATLVDDFNPPVDSIDVIGGLFADEQSYVYDPTNGITSRGWILRTNKGDYAGPTHR